VLAHTIRSNRIRRILPEATATAASNRDTGVSGVTEFQRIAGADGALYPFWSADSRWIGFFADGKLKRVDATGGTSPETICDAPYPRGGTWSRDGVIVMAARSGEGLVRVPASGGAPEPLLSLKEVPAAGLRWPHFLPDGHQFLFFRMARDPATDGVYVGSLDRHDARRIVAGSRKAGMRPDDSCSAAARC
jgi:hypothetical protein